jgi:hypothetical protein
MLTYGSHKIKKKREIPIFPLKNPGYLVKDGQDKKLIKTKNKYYIILYTYIKH